MTEVVAHYNLLERVGSGGLGELFRARDTERGRTVAVKMLPPEFATDPKRRERFDQETRDAACLSHPAIATLFESGEADGRLFLVFEFIEGQTLTRALAGGPLQPRQAVSTAIQIADALAEGHAAGILHRDIKPDNIMVTPKGAAKVLDFGLASWTTGGMAREMVASDGNAPPPLVASTIAYMSPEQALGQSIDARSDVFSLGVVLYLMLTGKNPFAAPTAGATLINLLQVHPQKPSELQSDVPPRLDEIVARALSKDVQGRYATAAEFAADLREVFGDRTEIVQTPAEQPEAVVVATTPPSRRGRLIALVALLAIVLGGAAAAYVYRAQIQGWYRQRFGPPPSPVIAVVPLVEPGERDSSFADGLTDDLVARLAQVPGVRVVGRSEIRRYRGRPPLDVARELRAATVLSGSVRREQGDLKVGLDLTDASDGITVWHQEFVNGEGAVFPAEVQMAAAVAEALKLPLVPNASRERSLSRSTSPDAYDLYAKGRSALAGRELDRAVQFFERAILLDGGLAEAHAGLAQALFRRAQVASTGVDDVVAQARVRDAAARAAAIDPDLPTVEVAQAMAAPLVGDAVHHLVRAAVLDPTDPQVYNDIGDELQVIDPPRALSLYERSRALDPRLADNYADLMAMAAARGDTKQTEQFSAELKRRSPRSAPAPPFVVLETARGQLAEGRIDEATTALQRLTAANPEFCEAKAVYAGVLYDAKRLQDAHAIADPILTSAPGRCAATAAAALGDARLTAAALRRIASDPALLRGWAQTNDGVNGEYSIALRRYPWSKVLDNPDVRAAMTDLRTAYAQVRAQTDKELRILPR